jgi:hypothetical protein
MGQWRGVGVSQNRNMCLKRSVILSIQNEGKFFSNMGHTPISLSGDNDQTRMVKRILQLSLELSFPGSSSSHPV